MRKRIYGIVLLVLLIIAVFGAGTVYGATSKPGSSGDPLITLSYLEERLSDTNTTYKKVSVTNKKTITFDSGSSVILYSGSAKISGYEGMINTTTGELYGNGSIAKKYATFVSPSSNSGFLITSDSVFFIQGGYSIK